MSTLMFERRESRAHVGLKGPRAAEWLSAQGMAPPLAPNTWVEYGGPGSADGVLLVARLGASEYFLEDGGMAADAALRRMASALQTPLAGIYPVLREDAAFVLSGEGAADVLAQVCNVNFAALALAACPVIMTLMIGVSVLIMPQNAGIGIQYRIWCDPTFGWYFDDAVGNVVVECGGTHAGVSA